MPLVVRGVAVYFADPELHLVWAADGYDRQGIESEVHRAGVGSGRVAGDAPYTSCGYCPDSAWPVERSGNHHESSERFGGCLLQRLGKKQQEARPTVLLGCNSSANWF